MLVFSVYLMNMCICALNDVLLFYCDEHITKATYETKSLNVLTVPEG